MKGRRIPAAFVPGVLLFIAAIAFVIEPCIKMPCNTFRSPVRFAVFISPFIAAIISIYYIGQVEKAIRFICLLMINDAVFELILKYLAIRYGNNHVGYSVNFFFEFCLTCLYFNYSIPQFEKKSVGIIIAILGSVIGLINASFIEPDVALKLNFCTFANIVIIALSIYSLYSMIIKRNDPKFMYNPHFWIASALMVFYLSDFTFWGMYNVIIQYPDLIVKPLLHTIHAFLVILFYLALDLVFLFIPFLKKNYEK